MNAATLPQRILDELSAADALEAQEAEARARSQQPVSSAAELLAQANPQAVAAPPPPAPAPAPAVPKTDDFEHKYRVLQGMYAADVTALKASVATLTSTVQSLKETPATTPQPAATVDPKDIENFGAEMMSMVQRYVGDIANKLDARLVKLEGNVTQVAQAAAQSSEQAFYTLLEKLVPDWRAVNIEPGWLQWLGIKDPVYDMPRQAALDHAFKRGDAQQVANVFLAFKASLPPVSVPPTLDTQLQPDTAGGNQVPNTPVQKPILTSKAVNDFYNDMAKGKYAGREAEAAAVEEIINLAAAENRIRG